MEIKNLFTPGAQQFGSQLAGVARKVTQPLEKPIQQLGEQFTAKVQPAIQGIQDTVNTGFVEPVMQPIKRNERLGKVNKFLSDNKITVDHIRALSEMDGSNPDEIIKTLRDNGIQIEGMESMEDIQAKQQEIPQGEDLGVMGNIKEGAIGAFRAGEQIPRVIGSGLGYVGEKIGEGLDIITPGLGTGSKELGQKFQQLGSDVTMAGMTDGGTNPLTQKQINARQTGGELALTAPIGGGYVAGAKGVGGLALRSGVVGAGFGAAQPIIDKGGQATMGDIATGGAIGGVTGAVAGPLISKVIAPAIGGIASKTGKYGQALVKGGAEGLKKSVARDISALKAPGIETVTRNIPKAVVRRDLGFTPTERAKIEKITGLDEGTYILNKGLAGKGKEELAEVFMKQSDDMYNGITRELSKVKTPVKSEVAKEALQDIMEQLESTPKIARAHAKDIAGVKSMLARDEFTLSELNNIRRAYDKVNTGMFTVQGKARSGLENAVDVKVRGDLSNQLQKEAKKVGVDVKAMNTELRAGLEMKDALLRRLSQEERNNFIGLQDLGVSAILSGGNPVSAVATIAAKKYAEKIAPGLAQKAYNLNKAPNVTRTVSRGNTITPRNKPSGLGLGNSADNTVVSNPVKKESKKGVVKKINKDPLQEMYDAEQKNSKPIIIEEKPVVVPKKTVSAPIVEKSGVSNEQSLIQTLKETSYNESEYFNKIKSFGRNNDISENSVISELNNIKKTTKDEKLVKSINKEIEYINNSKVDSRGYKLNDKGYFEPHVTPPSNAKQQGIKPKSTTTNVFGETIDKPSNKKGGFIKIPEIGKKSEIDANKFVKSKNPDITLTTFEGPDEINLYRLEIPKSSRKEGKGTKAMNDLIEYADKNGKRIVLTPDNYAGSSVSRLKEFYKRFGFVENTGRNKDFSTRELMYRTPKLKPEPKPIVKNPLVEENFIGGKGYDKILDTNINFAVGDFHKIDYTKPISTVGELFKSEKISSQFNDIKDIPVFFGDGKSLGGVRGKYVRNSDHPKGAIFITEKSIGNESKTILEEMIHAMQDNKGRLLKRKSNYQQLEKGTGEYYDSYFSDPNEVLAKRGAINLSSKIK